MSDFMHVLKVLVATIILLFAMQIDWSGKSIDDRVYYFATESALADHVQDTTRFIKRKWSEWAADYGADETSRPERREPRQKSRSY